MTSFHIYLYGKDAGPLSVSFDEVTDQLAQLDRLFQEPDGSFVWSPQLLRDRPTQVEERPEQIFGMVYDAVDRVQYIELRGCCQIETWRRLIAAIEPQNGREMMVMCLQNRQMQDVQTFEESTWKTP